VTIVLYLSQKKNQTFLELQITKKMCIKILESVDHEQRAHINGIEHFTDLIIND